MLQDQLKTAKQSSVEDWLKSEVAKLTHEKAMISSELQQLEEKVKKMTEE